MELSDRKKKILRAIVDLYIRTAEPVASKTIAQMPDMDFSSATIRNEMAELTTLGYLEQPHTSAGRIPSPAGYRLYVDELMQDYRLSTDETKSINQAMELKMQEVDKVVSQMTNLPAYAMAARSARLTVKRFDLILADSGSFILVVMLSDSSVKNKLIRLPVELTEADLKLLGAVLNASVTELTAEQLSPELLSRVTRSAGNAASLVPVVMEFVTSLLHQERGEVYMTGQAKLLGQPEYHDIDKAQKMLSALDEDVVSNLPAALSPDSRTQILVGPENVSKELRDTSVVMTKFDIGDGMQGLIGVVGPTRMDYAQITARLSYFAENLSRMFQKNQTPAIEGLENKHNDPEA